MLFLILLSVIAIDGDTIKLNGERIRLSGIDAPEIRQICYDEHRRAYKCGEESKGRLVELMGDRPIICNGEKLDYYGRRLAVCYSGAVNLNENMVESGEAVAYTKYSKAYVAQEADAKLNKRGLWRGFFMRPEAWRKK